jgi:hypothetical protein
MLFDKRFAFFVVLGLVAVVRTSFSSVIVGTVMLEGTPPNPAKGLILVIAASREDAVNSGNGSIAEESDATGQFRFRDLEPGKYYLAINRRGFGRFELPGPFSDYVLPTDATEIVIAAGETKRVDLVLHRGASIVGRVTGPNGKPILCSILANDFLPAVIQQNGTFLDTDGRFEIRGVPPGLDTHFIINPKDDLPFSYGIFRDVAGVRLKAGERLDIGEIKFEQTLTGTPNFTGTITNANGGPIPGMTVLTMIDESRFIQMGLFVNDGHFAQEVIPGKYRIINLAQPKRVLKMVEIQSGKTTEVHFEMAGKAD